MGRARNEANQFAEIAPAVRDIAADTLASEPTILLLLGPQAVQILRKIDRHQPVLEVELLALREAMMFAATRGAKMKGRLTESQRDQLLELVENGDLLGTFIVLTMPPAKITAFFEKRQRNPQARATVLLEPKDKDAQILIHRVASLYEPVFRWEPSIKAVDQNSNVRLTVTGDPELVQPLLETVFATLSANNYRGTWATEVPASAGDRTPNVLRRRLLR